VVVGYIGPVNGYLSQRGELRAEQANLGVLEDRRDSLQRQIAALKRPDVLEARARDLGMVRPGERAIIVQGELDPPPPAPAQGDDGLLSWLPFA
jgi:cell division protein FtsB